MKYNIRGDKMLITDAIKDYTETKLGRLEKYFKEDYLFLVKKVLQISSIED